MPREPREDAVTTDRPPSRGRCRLGQEIKALTFDVFGTVVDWRSSIEDALSRFLRDKVESSSFATLPPELKARARELLASGGGSGGGTRGMTSHFKPEVDEGRSRAGLGTWPGAFAAQWRASYGRFTRGFVPGRTPWKDIDTHHKDSLEVLLADWGLAGLFTDVEILELSRSWHRLDPWPDSARGIGDLGARGYVTSTLSNGNRSLLRDLDSNGALGFQRFVSSEDFDAYKPHPTTYLGAAQALGLRPDQVAMVAAHLGDLKGAGACGLRTIYVERLGEEEWREDEDRYKKAQEWVDVWIPLGKGGFVELARRLAGDAAE